MTAAGPFSGKPCQGRQRARGAFFIREVLGPSSPPCFPESPAAVIRREPDRAIPSPIPPGPSIPEELMRQGRAWPDLPHPALSLNEGDGARPDSPGLDRDPFFVHGSDQKSCCLPLAKGARGRN